VIPAFNAAATIAPTVAALLRELDGMAPALEVIVVDDGSTDATARIVIDLCQSHSALRLLRNRRNLGKGMAVYLGVLAARHTVVCFTDADLAFTPGSYRRVVQAALDGAPFVTASRRLPESEILVRMQVLGYAARRHVVGVSFNTFVRRLLGLALVDTQCGLKAFQHPVALDLLQRVRSPRFLFDIELFVAARQAGVAVAEVPVCVIYNDFKSSVRLVVDSTRMFVGLLEICARDRLGRYAAANPAMLPSAVSDWTEETTSGVPPATRAVASPT
jgi:dolichyl-phosphate beta-glucosyltransferase